eukprot:1052589-Pelagomonas_calceolata.AAC.2
MKVGIFHARSVHCTHKLATARRAIKAINPALPVIHQQQQPSQCRIGRLLTILSGLLLAH